MTITIDENLFKVLLAIAALLNVIFAVKVRNSDSMGLKVFYWITLISECIGLYYIAGAPVLLQNVPMFFNIALIGGIISFVGFLGRKAHAFWRFMLIIGSLVFAGTILYVMVWPSVAPIIKSWDISLGDLGYWIWLAAGCTFFGIGLALMLTGRNDKRSKKFETGLALVILGFLAVGFLGVNGLMGFVI